MTNREIVIDMRMLIDDVQSKVNQGQSVILKGEGVSMVPFITEGDILTLTKPKYKKAKIGEIYLYKREDGSYAIHRVYAVKKGMVYMLGDAQMFIEKVHPQCLVAVVSAVKRPHETVDCTNHFVRIQGAVRTKIRVTKVKSRRAYHAVMGRAGRLRRKLKNLMKKER